MSLSQDLTVPILVSSDDEYDDEGDDIAFIGSTLPSNKKMAPIIISSQSDLGDKDEPDDSPFDWKELLKSPQLPVNDELATDSYPDVSASTPSFATPGQESIPRISEARRNKRKVDDSAHNTQQDAGAVILSKTEKLARKESDKQEKELAKAAAKAKKEAEKSFQKKLADANRLRTSKNETVREIELYMSADMASPLSPIAGALPEMQSRFEESQSRIHFFSEDESPIPGVMKIHRRVSAHWDGPTKRFVPVDTPYWQWEKVVLVLTTAEDVVDKMIQGPGLLEDWISDIHLLLHLPSDTQIALLIKGMGRYQAHTKTLANRGFTAAARAGLDSSAALTTVQDRSSLRRPEKEHIEEQLASLQMRKRLFIVHVERTEEIEDWVWNLCADIALRPYKLLSKSHLSFSSGEKGRKASSGTDALELMLQEVPGITQSAASGIVAEYLTFAHLMEAFERAELKGGSQRGEVMLAECEIKNLKNGTASGRKLNKALARRVYLAFRGEDSLALA